MSILQPITDLEKWWTKPDPWDYEKNPDDQNRRAMLLSLLPQKKYNRVLDIGCGNGFVTKRLPGEEVIGVDISENAIKHARIICKEQKHITYHKHTLFDLQNAGWDNSFDLIIITGVLYPQYMGKSSRLVYLIIDQLLRPCGHLVSCHIEEWYTSRFPYTTIQREYYPYREYSHILEIYLKPESRSISGRRS